VDTANTSLMPKIRAVYSVYELCGFPASELDQRIRDVLVEESSFRQALLEIERIRARAASGATLEQIAADLTAATERLKLPVPVQEAVHEVMEAPHVIQEWKEHPEE
jgi:hypothetical protein